MCIRKFHDELHGSYTPAISRHWQGVKLSGGETTVGLDLEVVIGAGVETNIVQHLQPPASNVEVMVLLDNVSTESWNVIDAAVEGKKSNLQASLISAYRLSTGQSSQAQVQHGLCNGGLMHFPWLPHWIYQIILTSSLDQYSLKCSNSKWLWMQESDVVSRLPFLAYI